MQVFRAALVGVASLGAGAAAAQEVTLTARDGGLRVAGTLLGYDGAFYRVDTELGELTLDAARTDCAGPGCPDLARFVPNVRLSGSAEIGRVLLPALVEAYADRRGLAAERHDASPTAFDYTLTDADGTGVLKLAFSLTSSDEGFADLIANEADIALSVRPPSPAEVARGLEAGIGDLSSPPQSQILALDAVVPVVSWSNPIATIGYDDLGRVVNGEIATWDVLGRPNADLHLLVPPDDHPLAVFLARTGVAVTERATVEADDTDLSAAVAADVDALGLARFSDLGSARPVPLEGMCGATAIPGTLAIKTGDYPITTPLLLYRPARYLPPSVRDVLSFLLSPAAQPIVRRAGFIDQEIAEIPIDLQGRRLAQAIRRVGAEVSFSALNDLVARLSGGVRLTPTFRFEDGSATLDAQSRSSVLVLAQALQSGGLDGARIDLLGFSDGNGDAAANGALAQRRADAVLAALGRTAPGIDGQGVTLTTGGFGEVLPILCDGDTWGAEVNRRVEVWRFPGDQR